MRSGSPAEGDGSKMVVLDWQQCVALAEAHPDRYQALIYLALDAGMRWSELIGLRRGHVEQERRKVRVTEQLVELADRSRVRRQPKTSAGVRSITISATTASILGRHLEAYTAPDADALVFTNGAGGAISHSSFQTHHLKPAMENAGVRCASTICATRALRSRSRPAPTRRRSR